jgi:outer membrane lipoprotein-sorting protein
MKESICRLIAVVTVLGCLVGFSGPALAAEFSADVIRKMGDEVKKGKFFVKGNKMRMEFEEGITIMDMATGKTITLQPEEKMYIEMPAMGSPATAADSDEELAKIATKKKIGTEKVSGYQCDKHLITYHDKAMGEMTQWYAKKLNYPIKTVYHGPQGEMVTEYTNIKEGGVRDSVFEVPRGYQKMGIPGMSFPKR